MSTKIKICYLVHTEYHLLLSLNDILTKYHDLEKFEVNIILKRTSKSNRLKQDLDLNFLPYKFQIVDFAINLNTKLSLSEKQALDQLLSEKFDNFIFFQEQDPITIILINNYIQNNTNIFLYQDGLKPYIANSMKFSFGLVINDFNQNRWIKRNGYKVNDWFSFFNCKNYGFIKGIHKLYLTFPDAYQNWNNKQLEVINPVFTEEFKSILKRIFHWNDELLQEKDKVIFFMNQPMRDDGSFELNILKKLSIRYPENRLYIKYHPLTPAIKIEKYKELNNVTIIDSKIPAEIFISELTNSIVFSICSTSMFINNENSKFYWINEIKEMNNVERLNKYNFINPTNHIISAQTIDEIKF